MRCKMQEAELQILRHVRALRQVHHERHERDHGRVRTIPWCRWSDGNVQVKPLHVEVLYVLHAADVHSETKIAELCNWHGHRSIGAEPGYSKEYRSCLLPLPTNHFAHCRQLLP